MKDAVWQFVKLIHEKKINTFIVRGDTLWIFILNQKLFSYVEKP